MAKHKLDQATEEILQHYGIKGMSWGVRRSESELAAARDEGAGGGGGGEEEEDGFLDDMEDMFEDLGDTLGDISDDIKNKGKNMLKNFGNLFKVKTTTTRIEPKFNAKATKELRELAKKDANLNRNNTPKVFDKEKGWIVPKSVGGMKTRTETKGNTTRRSTTATSEGFNSGLSNAEAAEKAAKMYQTQKEIDKRKKKW